MRSGCELGFGFDFGFDVLAFAFVFFASRFVSFRFKRRPRLSVFCTERLVLYLSVAEQLVVAGPGLAWLLAAGCWLLQNRFLTLHWY